MTGPSRAAAGAESAHAPAGGPPVVLDPRRLAALDAVRLLDGDAERALAAIARRAAAGLGTPVAMVNLIDADRQFTTARAGPEDWPAPGPGAPLEASICRLAVERDALVAIEDTRADPSLAGRPAAAEWGVRAYAGVPLTAGGHALGALCVVDFGPRRWSGPQLEILRSLGAAAVAELEARAARAAPEPLVARLGAVRAGDGPDAASCAATAPHVAPVAAIARAIVRRTDETAGHVAAMARLCARLAHRLGMEEARALALGLAAALHDVGMIAVPAAILHAPDLDDGGRRALRDHAAQGHRMLAGRGDPLLDLAAEIALTHHERPDGSGYPRGLSGGRIPVAGRIAAAADAFDALAGGRGERAALAPADALAAMEEGRGRHYDPAVLDALRAEVAAPARQEPP